MNKPLALSLCVALLALPYLLKSCPKAQAEPSITSRLVKVADNGWSDNSVNTTVFRNSPLATFGDNQYVSYYDSDGYLTLGRRNLNDTVWTVSRTQYTGNVNDAHNVISMAVDGDGYLHLSFDHHGHPLKYCRSTAPESLQLGELEPMTGIDEGNVTYPEFYTLKNGDILFAYRSGSSGRGNLVMNRYDIRQKSWSRVQDILIDGEDERNAYWQLYVDAQGVIHVSWVWRETWLVETNHDLCYARSRDNGMTWERSDGTPYQLPINQTNAEYAWRIPQNSELINQTSMCTDTAGNPYIATYWRDADSDVPQYRLVWHDGEKWQSRQVGERTQPFSLSGGGTKMIPIARPRMAVDGDDIFYLMRDAERGGKVSLAHTSEGADGEWTITDLTDFSVDAWEPSIDTELWKHGRRLHVFVQPTVQGDGETTIKNGPKPIYVLEIEKSPI